MEPKTSAAKITQKYNDERMKRLREDGTLQYVELTALDKFKHYRFDPWLSTDGNSDHLKGNLRQGSLCKYLIIGAGFGGLLFAIRLLQAGIKLEDIYIVESAGSYGGTWYWNRYPGLMCDVESYVYMPLLEEMGYMPKHKYAYGFELREYAESIAQRWDLEKKTIFRTHVRSLTWDDQNKEWVAELSPAHVGAGEREFNVRAEFVFMVSGVLTIPKIPNIPGIEDFNGHTFHTSRWDYSYTGGTPQDPALVNLRDKKVGIIGTGATAIQIIPELAKWAKELYIFQRTPSSVDIRGQRPTDPDWWYEEVANKKGWQKARMENLNAHMSKVTPLPAVDMVDDQWTKIPTFHTLVGRPVNLDFAQIPAFLESLREQDLPHQQRIRARVDEIVKDSITAESLKPWYHSWCKRPCFHDDYLPSFNLPNVRLIDTDGKGIDKVTRTGVIYGEHEFDTDVLIFSTGYRTPAEGGPGARAGIKIIGRTGETLDEKWARSVGTLHGVVSRDFPNLFLPGPNQAGTTINWTSLLDVVATHVAYIVAKATSLADSTKRRITIEPTTEAEEEWSIQVASRVGSLAALSGCTPGALNKEGEIDRVSNPEEQMKAARGAPWGDGIGDYARILEGWRSEERLKGLDVQLL